MIFIERHLSGRSNIIIALEVGDELFNDNYSEPSPTESDVAIRDEDDDEDTELKHKYIKRTGRPGNYEYEYPGDKKERKKDDAQDYVNKNFEEDIDNFREEKLAFFEKESDEWTRSSNYESKQNAYDYVTRDFPEYGEKLREAFFKENTPEKITVYRVGATQGITSFFTDRKMAESYLRIVI